jgi:hypothetical protein
MADDIGVLGLTGSRPGEEDWLVADGQVKRSAALHGKSPCSAALHQPICTRRATSLLFVTRYLLESYILHNE